MLTEFHPAAFLLMNTLSNNAIFNQEFAALENTMSVAV